MLFPNTLKVTVNFCGFYPADDSSLIHNIMYIYIHAYYIINYHYISILIWIIWVCRIGHEYCNHEGSIEIAVLYRLFESNPSSSSLCFSLKVCTDYNYLQLYTTQFHTSSLPVFLKDRTEATSWGWYVGAFSTSSRALQRHPLGHGAVWEAAGGTLGLETCEVAACPRVIRSGFGAPWHKGCDVMYLNGSGGKMWRKTK